MSKVLVSKRGKAPMFYILAGFLFFVLGIWLFVTDDSLLNMEDVSIFILKIAPFALIATGILFLATARSYAGTYITVFDDRVEGSGTCGSGGLVCQSFHFDNRTNYKVTVERAFICVNANDVRYYISLSPSDRNDVMRAVTQKKVISGADVPVKPRFCRTAASSKKTVTRKCTFCGAKCKVPAGQGRISVTCPECKEQFTANS